MSLDWNATRVANIDELHAQDGEWEKTESLIWATLYVGMDSITEANWPEFYARFVLVNKLKDYDPTRISIEDIRRRIGLSTNARNYTELQFLKKLGSRELTEVASWARQQVEEGVPA